MRKVLTLVLVIFTLASMEAKMATLNKSGMGQSARPQQVQAQAQPRQQQAQNMPAWLRGGQMQVQPQTQAQAQAQASNKNKDQLANVTQRRNDALRQAEPQQQRNDQIRSESPAWQDMLSQVIAGVQGAGGVYSIPAIVSGSTGAGLNQILNNKGNDQLAPGSPNKNLDRLSRVAGRTMFGEGVGPGTLDPSLWNMAGDGSGGGFGSSYGGNWRGGGGGGGGGWGSDYGNADNYPAWLKIAMGLNSWNIK